MGMPRPPSRAILLLRRQLADELVRSLGPGSQHVIAPYHGIPQPRMSELGRGQVERCSLEWLIGKVHRLGGSVRIEVTLGDAQREYRRRGLARGVIRTPLMPKLE